MDKVLDKTIGFHFTIVDNYLLDHDSLTGEEQIVYVHLKKYANSNGECFPGIGTLADKLKWADNTVRKHLKALKEKGFVNIEHRIEGTKNKSNLYTLLPYPEYVEELKSLEEITGTGESKKGIGDVLKAYQNNINPSYGSMERERLIKHYEDFNEVAELIIKAIEIAVVDGVRKLKYIEAILNDWKQQGITTLDQAEAYTKLRNKREGKHGSARENNATDKSEGNYYYDFSGVGE